MRSHLYHLGVMRILNVCEIEKVCALYPDAWRRWVYRETDGNERLESCRKSFLKRVGGYGQFLNETLTEIGKRRMTFRRILIERRRGAAKQTYCKTLGRPDCRPLHWDLK